MKLTQVFSCQVHTLNLSEVCAANKLWPIIRNYFQWFTITQAFFQINESKDCKPLPLKQMLITKDLAPFYFLGSQNYAIFKLILNKWPLIFHIEAQGSIQYSWKDWKNKIMLLNFEQIFFLIITCFKYIHVNKYGFSKTRNAL